MAKIPKKAPTVMRRTAAKMAASGLKAANGTLKVGATVAQEVGGLMGHKAEQFVGTAKGIDNVLFKKVGFDERTFGRKLRPGAFGVFMGGAAVVGAAQGIREEGQEHIGVKDPNIYRATPTVPSYMDNGGATGDLVFDLYDLRNGGR